MCVSELTVPVLYGCFPKCYIGVFSFFYVVCNLRKLLADVEIKEYMSTPKYAFT